MPLATTDTLPGRAGKTIHMALPKSIPPWKAAPGALTPTRIAIYLFFAFLTINTVHRIRRWRRLRHIPGPWIAGFTSLWLVRRLLGPRIDKDWKRLVDTYGPIVRMSPNGVICADVNELVRIQSARSTYKKNKWYKLGQMAPPHHNLLSMLDKEDRRERKRKVTPGYSGRGGEDFEPGMNKAIASWIDLIERKYVSTNTDFRPFDFSTQAQYYSLDTLGEIAYSKQLGFLKNDKDMNEVLAVNESSLPVLYILSNFDWLMRCVRMWPLKLLLPRAGDGVGFGSIMGFVTDIIDQRLADPKASKTKGDILQSFINEELTRDELKEEVTIQFFVGSDTTSSLIRMTLLALLTNPCAHHTIQSELDRAIKNNLISSPITNSEARQHLPYFQSVIRESIRFFPPVACGVFYKDVPPGGDTVCGQFLPEGTSVSTVAGLLAMNRSKAIWGEDADCFRPERWGEAERMAPEDGGQRLRGMVRGVEMNFGSGQFLCSGRGIALMQANKVLPELLRRYNFLLVDPVDPIKLRGAIAWLAHDFWVKAERRSVAME